MAPGIWMWGPAAVWPWMMAVAASGSGARKADGDGSADGSAGVEQPVVLNLSADEIEVEDGALEITHGGDGKRDGKGGQASVRKTIIAAGNWAYAVHNDDKSAEVGLLGPAALKLVPAHG